MLTLKIIGSSSKGNCFAIKENDRYLLLECGIKDTKKYIDLTKTDGILISHQHLDHCGGIKHIKNYYNGKFYANKETTEEQKNFLKKWENLILRKEEV